MGIYVPNKCWKFRLKFPIRLRENQIFVVVCFFGRTLYVFWISHPHWFLFNYFLIILVLNFVWQTIIIKHI